MRPNIGEIMAGINKTIMVSGMPIAQQAGETQALWELAAGTRLMSYVEQRWKNEFGNSTAGRRLPDHQVVTKLRRNPLPKPMVRQRVTATHPPTLDCRRTTAGSRDGCIGYVGCGLRPNAVEFVRGRSLVD